MSGGHSLLNPSSAPRWMRCPGSVALSHGVGDTSSEYADEGTAAHTLAAWCLTQGKVADDFIGQTVHVYEDDGKTVRRSYTVDPDMASYVQVYVDAVLRTTGQKLYEQRVNYSEFIGVPESTGTSDTVVLDVETETLESHDLKFGRGVKVDAKWIDDAGNEQPNEQLALYLLGALSDNDLLADWKHFKLAVHQPRLDHYDELVLTRAQLMAFAQSARAAAAEAMSCFTMDPGGSEIVPKYTAAQLNERGLLRPGTKQCQFCPAAEAGLCPRLEREVKRIAKVDELDGMPVDPDTLPIDELPPNSELELIELWVKGVRSRVQRELQAGKKLRWWKLVRGKMGPRQWAKDKLEDATKIMKKLLKKEAFTEPQLLSPAQAEALLKKQKRGAEYAKLAEFITQAQGGEHVAPIDDPRPAIEKLPAVMMLDTDSDLL